MVIKIFKLKDLPGGRYELNDSKSRMFAHSGAAHWDVSLKLMDMSGENFDLWEFMYVGLPMMHMALELMIKAFVTFYDSTYNAKSDKHKTSKIIDKYVNAINAFKLINNDKEKMKLVKMLELAWEGLRYAECSLQYNSKDGELFNKIMTLLTNEYKRISKLRTL